MNIFLTLVKGYLVSHPEVVQRLASMVLHGLIDHIAPSTAAELSGEASASPLAGAAGLGSVGGQVIGR